MNIINLIGVIAGPAISPPTMLWPYLPSALLKRARIRGANARGKIVSPSIHALTTFCLNHKWTGKQTHNREEMSE